jgi:hypothetical protein
MSLIGQNWRKKLDKKLDIWQGSSLSIGGGTTLIKASLSSTVIYQMSMFLLPKTSIETMEKTRRFFWQGEKIDINIAYVTICGFRSAEVHYPMRNSNLVYIGAILTDRGGAEQAHGLTFARQNWLD